jgi:putative PIN family toxin of toxin-antitoxin system
MSRRPRLVIDTNVLVSAFLWQGTPGRLIERVGNQELRLFTSRVLLDELDSVLHRKKLAQAVAATGLTADAMLANFRKLATVVTARQLTTQVSRDADDDAVLACARAARANLIVSGDDDLLVLGSFESIPIVTASQALTVIG